MGLVPPADLRPRTRKCRDRCTFLERDSILAASSHNVVQDLCDSLCTGLQCADWPLLNQPKLLFTDDVVTVLCSPVASCCTNDIKSWLEAGCWWVLQEKGGMAADPGPPVWEVSCCKVAGMLRLKGNVLIEPAVAGSAWYSL